MRSSTASFRVSGYVAVAVVFFISFHLSSLPTYPSDHITEEEEQVATSAEFYKDHDFKSMEKTESAATPSLVARLMGLESFPDVNCDGGYVNGQSTLHSISRSKSMNSMDRFAAGGDDPVQAQHRKVKIDTAHQILLTSMEGV
ncbi:Hypothetical predicted protein [Prunus dulcis]|uniref:DUF3741 domain-containing protein n=1 Tax=Prunus dulcis TaxID=3755 RepID=A0A5E4FKZ8_PRUDU|nr:Hypothetical predicted protein [Prunus dulcis]